MKIILASGLILLSRIGAILSVIWAVVEFILYLAKDKAFNWWCIWTLIICVLLPIVVSVITLLKTVKNNSFSSPGKKSAFQMRLEEEMKKRLEAQAKNKK